MFKAIKKVKNIIINKKFLLAIVVLAILFGATSIVAGYASYAVNIYPQIGYAPKTTTLKCPYDGKNLTLDVHLNGNINNYYHNYSVKNTIIENKAFSNFIYTNPQDKTIKKLAEDVKKLGNDEGLSGDQILELATCFVQNIPYDHGKAKRVLGGEFVTNYDLSQFPYETLFKNSGICTDKTYLGGALLKELGYGTAVMLFPTAQHMALGIKAPAGYTEFNSDYIMIELTNPGFAPGEIPSEINELDGLPSVTYNNLDKITTEDDPAKISYFIGDKIEAPTLVINANKGEQYNRIVPIKNLENKIVSTVGLLVELKPLLIDSYTQIQKMDALADSAYNNYLAEPTFNYVCGYKYNYFTYRYDYQCNNEINFNKNTAHSTYLAYLNTYNRMVNDYNGMIAKYNSIVDQVNAEINLYKSYRYN